MSKLFLPAVLLALAITVSACDIDAATDAFDQFDVIVELEPIETTVAVTILDARSDNFVSSDVTLRFVGDDAGSIIDMFSDALAEQEVAGGLTSFGIRNSVVPSEANPVEFRVIASANGYEVGAAHVRLTSSGASEVRVRLISSSPAQAPTGGGSSSSSIPTSGGTVQNAVTLQTTNTSSGSSASVTIPAGTQAATSTGAPAHGQIATTVTYYQASATRAVPLPTGSNTSVQSSSGSTSNVTLSTVASANIQMTDASGASITQFSAPVAVRMGLDSQAVNPATGALFLAGDQIEIFNFNESQGTWVSKGMGSVATGAGKISSTLEISFSTLVAGTFLAGVPSGTCSVDVNLTANSAGGSVSGTIYALSMSTGVLGPFGFGPDVSSIRVPDLPNVSAATNTSAALTFSANDGTTNLTVTLPADCGTTKTVILPTPPASTIDVTFSLQISSTQFTCPTGALRITGDGVPALVIMRKVRGSTDSEAVTVSGTPMWTVDAQNRIMGGSIMVPGLVQGQTYTFITSINGERQERDSTISGANEVLDISADVREADICAQ